MNRCYLRIAAFWLLCSTAAAAQVLQPGYRPPTGSEEAALWYAFDKGEQVLKLSPLRIRDDKLQGYIKRVVCRLVPEHCKDIRVHITRNPEFNAAMSANGALNIWSGALLRMRNEAQLAALLGHEISHYLRRDALKQWRSAKQTGALAELLSFGISPVGELISGGLFATLLPFSQRQEIDADDHGLQMMIRAGYDPTQAAAVWESFAAEQRAANLGGTGAIVLSTHPGSDSRAARLHRKLGSIVPPRGDTGTTAYREIMRPWWTVFLQDQIKSYQPRRTRHILDTLKTAGMPRGQWLYFNAELERQIGGRRQLAIACDLYRQSIAQGGPAIAWRDLGYTEMRRNNHSAANAALRRYLQRVPGAPDRRSVLAMLHSMERAR